VILEPRAADLDLVDVETALLRAAVGDYAAEAAVLLLANTGHWLPQLQAAGLITLLGDVHGDGLWAQIVWPDLDTALRAGTIHGSSGQLHLLRVAASLADGQPVDLGDVAAGLDRAGLALALAAVAHAGGSHGHCTVTADDGGMPHAGEPLPPLVAWPTRS
jgi:hypothetical protein